MAGPLGPGERYLLADALGDTPETVIPVHLLRHGLCEAWGAGSLPDSDATWSTLDGPSVLRRIAQMQLTA